MKTIKIEDSWLNTLLPEGFPYPSSTVISGPGGTGKPLVEFAFVAAWLKSGGSVIGIPLQYPTIEFVQNALQKLYGIDIGEYRRNVVMIRLDTHIDGYENAGGNILNANLLNPAVWNAVLDLAGDMLGKGSGKTMVFGSALNLLLFSPTYKDAVIENLQNIIKNDKSKTYVFSVSTSAFADEIEPWENAADNLMFTRMEKPMRLFFKIRRMRGVDFSDAEVPVPIPRETLMEIKDIAETTRKKTIPEIMRV